MIHCAKEDTENLLTKPGAQPFEMRGRVMNGWLRVEADAVKTKRRPSRGLNDGIKLARSLPPKKKK